MFLQRAMISICSSREKSIDLKKISKNDGVCLLANKTKRIAKGSRL